MATFFVISGFFVNFLLRPFFKELVGKIKRLVLPYFIWSFILAASMQVASKYTNSGLGLKDFISSPIKPFSEYWYLYVLFFIFLAYLIVNLIFGKHTQTIMLSIGVLLFVSYPLLPNIWIIVDFSKYLFFFAVGNFTFKYVNSLKLQKVKFNFCLLLFCFVVVNYVYLHILKDSMIYQNYFYILTAYVGLLFVFYTSVLIGKSKIVRLKELLQLCGKNSMQIYVMHLLPLAGLRIILLKVAKITNLWLTVIFIFIFAIIACLIGILIFKKLHLNKLLFGEF